VNAVALGTGDKILVAHDLQIEIAPRQQTRECCHAEQGNQQAAGKQLSLTAIVPQQLIGIHR